MKDADKAPIGTGSEQMSLILSNQRNASTDRPDFVPSSLRDRSASQYRARWFGVIGRCRHPSSSIFRGRSLATSLLSRLSVCGSIIARSLSIRAFSSGVLASMGFLYSTPNLLSEPKSPGWMKSKSDHRSAKEFSTGVPVHAILKRAFCFFAARDASVFGF